MTIAVGVLAGNNIVLASDTEHNYDGGDIKGNEPKIMASCSMSGGDNAVLASTGIVGSGYTDYVNSIRVPISQYLLALGQSGTLCTSREDITAELERKLTTFYAAHVLPFYQYDGRVEFDLLIAARFNNLPILLVSGKTSIRPVVISDCIGRGRSFGTTILNTFPRASEISVAVMQACYMILQVKDTVKDCGQNTQVLCLTEKGPFYIPDDMIQELEAVLMHYSKCVYDLLGDMFRNKRNNMKAFVPIKKTISRIRQAIVSSPAN